MWAPWTGSFVHIAHLVTHKKQPVKDQCYCTCTSVFACWVQYRVATIFWGAQVHGCTTIFVDILDFLKVL